MIKIQAQDFSIESEYAALREQSPASGAIVTFSGLVRDTSQDKKISAIELEHFPEMTERVLQEIEQQAHQRWPLDAITIIHRIGKLSASEQIVFVGVASAHRAAAFSACEFLMDFLKTKAPFWKKEYSDNGDYWVDAKQSDNDAADRWK